MSGKKRGQVLIGAVIAIFIVSIIALLVISMVTTESYSAVQNLTGIQALNLAEGGVQFTMVTSLSADSDWSDNSDFGPVAFNNGSFTVQYIEKRKKTCVIEVTGLLKGVSRKVRARFKTGLFPLQFLDYGCYGVNPMSSGKDLDFLGRSKVIGSFFYFGPINISGQRPPPCQTGGTLQSISINTGPGNWWDYYTSWEAIDEAEPIGWNNSYYDDWLSVAASSTKNDLILGSGQSLDLAGGTYKYQNIDLSGTATIIGPGTLCATTSFRTTPGNYVTFVGPVRLISLGSPTSFDLNGSTTWSESAEVIAFDNLKMTDTVSSPANSIFYSKGPVGNGRGIAISSYASPQGSLLAPYGLIDNGGRAWVKGLVFAYQYNGSSYSTLEGGAVFDTMASFQDESMVIQNNDVLPDLLPPGLTSEAELSVRIYDWGEVY